MGLFLGCMNQDGKAVPASASDEELAPDFKLPLVSGDSLQLSDLRGRVVVLNFWATWCAPCLYEIPDLWDLHQELEDKGLSVVGVSLDTEPASLVQSFLDDRGAHYPNVLDPEAITAEAYGGVFGLPTTFVIDQAGRIVHRSMGIFPFEQMRPLLEELLANGSS